MEMIIFKISLLAFFHQCPFPQDIYKTKTYIFIQIP